MFTYAGAGGIDDSLTESWPNKGISVAHWKSPETGNRLQFWNANESIPIDVSLESLRKWKSLKNTCYAASNCIASISARFCTAILLVYSCTMAVGWDSSASFSSLVSKELLASLHDSHPASQVLSRSRILYFKWCDWFEDEWRRRHFKLRIFKFAYIKYIKLINYDIYKICLQHICSHISDATTSFRFL